MLALHQLQTALRLDVLDGAALAETHSHSHRQLGEACHVSGIMQEVMRMTWRENRKTTKLGKLTVHCVILELGGMGVVSQ